MNNDAFCQAKLDYKNSSCNLLGLWLSQILCARTLWDGDVANAGMLQFLAHWVLNAEQREQALTIGHVVVFEFWSFFT